MMYSLIYVRSCSEVFWTKHNEFIAECSITLYTHKSYNDQYMTHSRSECQQVSGVFKTLNGITFQRKGLLIKKE